MGMAAGNTTGDVTGDAAGRERRLRERNYFSHHEKNFIN